MTATLVGLVMAIQTPVAMSVREIGPPTPIQGGRTVELQQGELKATLFVPDGWAPGKRNSLWMHFHSADWFVVSEYQRAKVADPSIVFNFGQGSTVYANPFKEPGTLKGWIEQASKATKAEFDDYHFTSFSAGYGAVRNLVADPAVLDRLRTVILCDSMYGSLDPAMPKRSVLEDHVRCWNGLRDKALSGEATWLVATTQITPEAYAGTWEVASALVASLNGSMVDVAKGTDEASSAEPYRLLRTFSKGRLIVWSYAGEDARAHMTSLAIWPS